MLCMFHCVFAIGVLAYRVFESLRNIEIKPLVVEASGLAIVLLLLVAIAATPSAHTVGAKIPLWGLLFGTLCVWQALVPGRIARSRPLVFLGERSYSIYLWACIIFPLFSATRLNPLLSYPRFLIVLFPAFMALALVGRNRYAHQLILWTSLLLLALFTIRFANWFWVA